MMRYFRNPLTNEVFGYDDSIDHQLEHMNWRIAEENLVEITGNWPPPDPPEEPEPDPVPTSITRPQAAKQLLYMGYITDDEAIAMAQSGIAPTFVRQHINTGLPAPDRVSALIDFTRYTYDRNHPLLLAMVAANGFSAEEVDHFFMQAATL